MQWEDLPRPDRSGVLAVGIAFLLYLNLVIGPIALWINRSPVDDDQETVEQHDHLTPLYFGHGKGLGVGMCSCISEVQEDGKIVAEFYTVVQCGLLGSRFTAPTKFIASHYGYGEMLDGDWDTSKQGTWVKRGTNMWRITCSKLKAGKP